MKITINDLGLETNLTDLRGSYYAEENFEKIKEELSNDEEYQDDWFYFYKDGEDIVADIMYGTFEIIDVINSWEICKNDPFIMIVKDSYCGGELEYVAFDGFGCEDPPTLKGGEYDKKQFADSEELDKFNNLVENEEIENELKYQEFYFERSSNYNSKEWINKWISEDNDSIDKL